MTRLLMLTLLFNTTCMQDDGLARRRWSARGGSPLVATRNVVIASWMGEVVGWDASSGQRRWTVTRLQPTAMTVTQPLVILGGADSGGMLVYPPKSPLTGAVAGVVLANGLVVWQIGLDCVPTNLQSFGAFIVGVCVEGDVTADGIALEATTGRILWRVRLDGVEGGKPAVDKDLAVLATRLGSTDVVTAVDLHSGRIMWVRQANVQARWVDLSNGAVVVGGGCAVRALAKESGDILWDRRAACVWSDWVVEEPAVVGDRLLQPRDGAIDEVDVRSGNVERIWDVGGVPGLGEVVWGKLWVTDDGRPWVTLESGDRGVLVTWGADGRDLRDVEGKHIWVVVGGFLIRDALEAIPYNELQALPPWNPREGDSELGLVRGTFVSALGVVGDSLYWTDGVDVFRVPLAGGAVAKVYTPSTAPEAFAVGDGGLFWATCGTVFHMDLVTGEESLVVDGVLVTGLVADGNDLYWSGPRGGGAVLAGGEPVVLTDEPVEAMAARDGDACWVSRTGLACRRPGAPERHLAAVEEGVGVAMDAEMVLALDRGGPAKAGHLLQVRRSDGALVASTPLAAPALVAVNSASAFALEDDGQLAEIQKGTGSIVRALSLVDHRTTTWMGVDEDAVYLQHLSLTNRRESLVTRLPLDRWQHRP